MCSSWPAPRAANTCGGLRWRATPSFVCASQPQARPVAATSDNLGLVSDSGSAQRCTPTWLLFLAVPFSMTAVAVLQKDNARCLTQVVVASTSYQHMGNNVSHKTEPLYLWLQRIYGYVDLFLWRLRCSPHIVCFLVIIIRDGKS